MESGSATVDMSKLVNHHRRHILRAAMLPLGAVLLSACGGGSSSAAATQAPDLDKPLGGQGETESDGATGGVVADRGPSPSTPPAPTGPVPAWVAGLPLWHWHEIPGTSLASVNPAVRRLGITGPSSKIDAWCGATLKRKGSVYMLGAAGGHGDYAGNEVNALALNTENPRWVELSPASSNDDIINATQFYLDHKPAATHTYYSTQFIDELDRMMVFASPGLGGPFPKAPEGFPYVGDRRSFSFHVGSGAWDAPDYVAQFPAGGDFTAALCVKHPRTGDVYYSRNSGNGWYRWTRVNNTWNRLSGVTRAPWYAGAAIDPVRERMLVVGSYGPTAPLVLRLDGSGISVPFAGLGADVLTLSGYPGVVYDEAIDCYLVAYNEGGVVRTFRVNAENWSVDAPVLGSSLPAARRNGVLNAFQYVPELRGVVIANAHAGNVWFMRTAA